MEDRLHHIRSKAGHHFRRHKFRYLLYVGFILGYLLFSWFMTIIFDPYHNLVARYILFTLFLLPVVAFIRWDDNRIVIAVCFVLFNLITGLHTLFFPHFYGILTPFFPLFHQYRGFLPTIASYNDTGRRLLQIARFGYLIDLCIVLSLAGIVSLFSHLVDSIRKRYGKKLLTIIAVFLFLAIMLMLPYLVMLVSGSMNFGLAYTSGSVQFQLGIEQLQKGDITKAMPFFREASDQYELAKEMFSGLEELGLFNLIRFVDPGTKGLIDNGKLLIQASFLLADVFLPLLDGITTMEGGFNNVIADDLNPSLLQQVTFQLQNARKDFLTSQLPLQLALLLLHGVNIGEFSRSTRAKGIGDYSNELLLAENSGQLFNTTLQLLLIQLLPIGNYSFPIHHALHAIYQTRIVQEQIGNNSRFGAVIPTFSAIHSNLSVVQQGLNESQVPEFQVLEDDNVGGFDLLKAVKHQILGIFQFLRDLVGIGLNISVLGREIAGILRTVNSTLLPLTSKLTLFPQIDTQSLDHGIAVLGAVRDNSTRLMFQSEEISSQVSTMENRAKNGTYGLFSQQALKLVHLFQGFDLETNISNFYHLASAAYFIIIAIKEFQTTSGMVDEIRGNLTRIQNSPSDPVILENSVNAINQTIDTMVISIGYVRSNLTEAQFHLRQIHGMPEADSLSEIVRSLLEQLDKLDPEGILDQITSLSVLLKTPADPAILSQILEQVSLIDQLYSQVDGILSTINVQSSY